MRKVKDLVGGILLFAGAVVAFLALDSAGSFWKVFLGMCIAVGLWIMAVYLIREKGKKIRGD